MAHHDHTPFGGDRFGQSAERFARFFGTPRFIIAQTVIVAGWIAGNAWLLSQPFDPTPFILLNLCFSTQAAYAAPLILLAQTRQADRDKAQAEALKAQAQADVEHRNQLAELQAEMLAENTEITRRVCEMAAEIRQLVRGHDTPGA